jgi:putative ATPase
VYPLAEAAFYLATAPKSHTYFHARAQVEAEGVSEVPDPLKDASCDARGLGHGKGYPYPHDYAGHWVAQNYLPREIAGMTPSQEGYERVVAERLVRGAAQGAGHREARSAHVRAR